MESKKIGIMGGTFNPIHNGHLALANAAFRYCELDEVWFMPSGISYLKLHDNVVPAHHRLKMTELAVEPYPLFKVSDIEVEREGNTYTVDTLRFLHDKYPEFKFYFIMGADSLYGLPKWKEPEVIASLCSFAVVTRDDIDSQELMEKAECIKTSLKADVIIVPFSKLNISSRNIREMLKNNCSVDGILPEKVLNYIKKNCLYSK